MVIPSEITAGETLRITGSSVAADFAASAVTLHLRGPSSLDADATVTGDTFAASADTAALAPGKCAVEVWGTDATGAKRVLARSTLTVRASLASAGAGYDPRTDAERALEKIRAALAGDISEGVKSYTINNRTLERYSMGELLQLEKHYAAIVARETRRARGVHALGPRIAVRF